MKRLFESSSVSFVQDRFFPGAGAVGRRVKLGDEEAEIVGVVGNIRRAAVTDAPHADMYFPQEHAPGTGTTLFIRTSGNPAAVVPALPHRIAHGGTRRGPARHPRHGRCCPRVGARDATGAVVAGVVCRDRRGVGAVGIYGVMSYSVRGRMREIGTRMALGATRASILRLVLGQGARIAIVGAAVGVGVTLFAGRAWGTLLYSTSTADPYILAGSAILLLVVAALACYVPGRRATRADPMTVLTQ